MPRVKSSVIHPNSRKAAQLIRLEHRMTKLDKRKVEANLRSKAKSKKLKWFKGHIDTTKEVLTTGEVKDLIERYLKRFSEEEKLMEENQSITGRINKDRLGHAYKTKFTIEKEKREYEGTGLEVPILRKKDAYKYFIEWSGESKFHTAIHMEKICSKSK